jgi:DNA mismatch repair protein MutS
LEGASFLMEIDKTTLIDLSILNTEEEFSVFNKLNFCLTVGGKAKLFDNFSKPLGSIEAIEGIQQTLQLILQKEQYWPRQISNGTVMMVEKFYQSAIDEIPSNPSSFTAFTYKLFHGPDFSLVKYSVGHGFDFIKGIQLLLQNFYTEDAPLPLKKLLMNAHQIIHKEQFTIIENNNYITDLSIPQQLHLANFLRYHYKQNMLSLIDIYDQLDAWYGMAMAVKHHGLSYTTFYYNNRLLMM